MDFNATKLFVSVVQAGSLSAASAKLSVPVSTISRKISALERELRVQLLERSKQGVKPTSRGQQFFEQSRVGLEILTEAQKSVQSVHKLQGKLRISVPPDFSPWWDLLVAFQQRYPDIKIYCHSGERVIDLFEDGIDVALRMGKLHTDDVIAKPVMTIDTLFVASPALLASTGTPQSLAELARLPVASWESLNHNIFEWGTGSEKVRFEPIFTTNNIQGLCHFVLSGAGISQIPDFAVRPYLDNGRLIELLPWFKPTLQLHLIYARHKHPSAIVMAYLDFCTEWVARPS